MARIGIFTTTSDQVLHPRIFTNKIILEVKNKILVFSTQNNHDRFRRINNLFFNFFYIDKVIQNVKHLEKLDIIYIQALYLLPLAIFGKIKRKTIIYETLDNNPHLKFYDLTNRYRIMKYLKFIRSFICLLEKFICKYFVDHTIVNSKALEQYFNGNCELIYYTSSLEALNIQNKSNNKVALMYLGAIREDKGFFDILQLQKELDIPLFLLGKLEKEGYNKYLNNPKITHYPHRSQVELQKLLNKLLSEFYLLGCSFTKSKNYSYATQELNKDIDFLSLGIPIIGNMRQPTLEKIKAGCGYLYNDISQINVLTKSHEIQTELTSRCISYYNKYYSNKIYKHKLEQIFND